MDATNVGSTAPPPVPPVPPTGPRQLRRRPDEGPIGGVCAGVADYFNVDPVIVRIAAVVLALSGPGLIAYLAAWIFVPAANDSSPGGPWRSHLEPHRDRGAQIFGIVLLVVALSILWGGWWSPFRRWLFPLALIGIGAWLLLRRDDDAGLPLPVPPVPPVPPTDSTADTAADSTATDDTVETSAMEDATLVAGVPAPPPPPVPPWAYGNHRHGPWRGPGWREEVPPELLAARRRRRLVFPIVMGGLLIWGGLAFLTGVSVQTGLAIALCILGVGFVLGAFVGGSKALIIPAFFVTCALVLTAALDLPLNGPIGERAWTPESMDELRDLYELSMGEGRLDLTRLPLEDGQDIDVRATIGMGSLTVILPDDVVVDVRADASMGEIVVLGDADEGFGVSTDRRIDPDERDITIDLDLEVGLGEIKLITREPDVVRERVPA